LYNINIYTCNAYPAHVYSRNYPYALILCQDKQKLERLFIAKYTKYVC